MDNSEWHEFITALLDEAETNDAISELDWSVRVRKGEVTITLLAPSDRTMFCVRFERHFVETWCDPYWQHRADKAWREALNGLARHEDARCRHG